MKPSVRSTLAGVVLMAGILSLSLGGCSDAGAGGDGGGGTNVSTVLWEEDGKGYVQYKTNDSNTSGTLQFATVNGTTGSNSVQVETKKLSGDASGFYGMLFGHQDNDNYYVLVVDYDKTDRWYELGKYEGGTYSAIKSYQKATAINNDSADSITMRVSRTDGGDGYGNGTGDITIEFKSGSEASFTTEATVASDAFSLGSKGFVVEITSSENFPDTPVDVRFKMLTPVSVP